LPVPLVELPLALPLVRAACAIHAGMATFAEAAVPDRAG